MKIESIKIAILAGVVGGIVCAIVLFIISFLYIETSDWYRTYKYVSEEKIYGISYTKTHKSDSVAIKDKPQFQDKR